MCCKTAGAPKSSDQWWVWAGGFFPPGEVRGLWDLFRSLAYYSFPKVGV